MGKISSYPVVTSMGNNDYFLIDTTPIVPNSTSIITKANALSSILTNPMSTLGDSIYGAASGVATRLAGNTSGTKNFLTQTGTGSVSAAPAWGTISAGDVPTLNQNTTGVSGTTTAALGLKSATTIVAISSATAPSSGQVLTATGSSAATWQNSSAGFANPMTTNGDIIYGASAGAATRLAAGSSGQVLTVSGGIPSWATPSANTATFFDVKTYGAVGNGSNDDTSSIQSAINAALATPEGTGTVYFPAGTYKITGSLNCTSATGSASGYGVILRGDGHRASTIFKASSFGAAVTFNGNGGPDGNNTQFGGMIDITIEGNATTGGLLQTNSAQQMFFRGCSFSGSNSWAWDLHTMQDSYFSQCSFNTNGSTSDYVIKIYGDVNGTSNMLWFNQIRVEDFLLGGIHILRGAGATGGGNNGFFFSQCKIENAGRVHGDLFVADGYTQQLVMDQIFLSAGAFNGGFSTPVNGIVFGDGTTGVGDNQATFTNIFMNAGTGVGASTINVKGASGMNGPVTIDNIVMDNTPTTGCLVVNSASNLNFAINNLSSPNPLIAGDGTYYNASATGWSIFNSGIAIQAALPAVTVAPAIGGYYDGLGIGGNSHATSTPIFGVLNSTQSGEGIGSTAFTVTDSNVVQTFHNALDDGAGNVVASGTLTANAGIWPNHAVTVTSNAGSCSVAFRLNTFINSSAATMAITIPTSGAVNGQEMIVRVLDFSAAAETIGWTNTENSTATVPTTSNGSTTLPLTVMFMYNSATSKWRCMWKA